MVRIPEITRIIKPSPIRVFTERIIEVAKNNSVLRFDIGDRAFIPKIDPGGFRDEDSKYSSSGGYLELRKLVAQEYSKYDISYENIGITEGSSLGLLYSIAGMLGSDVGEGIIVPTPGFATYDACAKVGKGYVVPLPCRFEDGFKLPSENSIDKLIMDHNGNERKINAIILTSPSNPTGHVLSREEYETVAAVANKHDLIVLVDRAYERFDFTDNPVNPFEIGSLRDRLIGFFTFSKTYGLSGARVGAFVTANPDLSEYIFNILDNLSSRPGYSQRVAIQIYESTNADLLRQMNDKFKKRMEIAAEELSEIEGLQVNIPKGSFYIYPRILGMDTKEFFYFVFSEEYYKSHKINSFIPGSAFYFGNGKTDEARFALVQNQGAIREGIRLFGKQLEDYRKHIRGA
ncbi:MAG TPA: pyridoxal phosphate-dependent aminotransferase [Candidatus Nanoarchaeia archaeon]|nr:pyridoxal phosphate-dependent aminotransferase [Candidatus Nanoarchaeia archaeon]